ncbi:MAG: hypothetical protein XD88_2012 [Methanocalculus sp. 52_23]|jgi:hypothetical protein|nr:MAG: hypothetical protein XD88_2012 [Methanocalculus sp. 52_23]
MNIRSAVSCRKMSGYYNIHSYTKKHFSSYLCSMKN